ncbi:MAG: hypothetical protein ACON47_03135 [Flavobacteriaceae bacterium]
MKSTLVFYYAGLLIVLFILSECAKEDNADNIQTGQNTFSEKAILWDGPLLRFTKSNGADPSLAANQDRISDRVWLTRGNDGKQIFNIQANKSANKQTSPEGTLWALGSLNDVASLEFYNFRSLGDGKPKSLINKNLVLHLTTEDIYLSVKFTSWSQDKKGGFAYERSTNPQATAITTGQNTDAPITSDTSSPTTDTTSNTDTVSGNDSNASDSANTSDSDSDDDNDNDDDDNDDDDNDDDDNDDDDNDDDDNTTTGDSSTSNPFDTSAILWQGNTLSFTKADGADPNQTANQDRITDKVWITRANDGQQIYNAAVSSSALKSDSPIGTEWAVGSLDQVADLGFQNFRDACNGKPKNMVGVPMVLHLIEDNIYLNIKLTSWSNNKSGGFAYERSTL